MKRASLSLRIARRMAMQAVGRSIMVALLIAIPITGLAAIDTIEASHRTTPADTVRFDLGRTQAHLDMVSAPDPDLRQDPYDQYNWKTAVDANGNQVSEPKPATSGPAAFLPAGTRILSTRYTTAVARTKTGSGSFTALQGQPWDPAFAGKYDLVDGRRPTKASEIMVSPSSLERFGISIGQEIHEAGPVKRDFTVVGTLKDASARDAEQILYGDDGVFDGTTAAQDPGASEWYLPSTAVPWSMVRQLNTEGAVVLSREVLLGPTIVDPGGPEPMDSGGGDLTTFLFVALLGAFGLFEVCLLAGAAFAVGARQRQRSLAILASVGADRGLLFRVLSIEGVLLGLVGGLVGTALGVLAAWIAEPIIAGGLETQFPAFRPDWLVLALIVAASTFSGWAAAAFPARVASRVDVVAALRGARRPPPVGIKKPVAGIFVASAGSVVALAGGLLVIASQASEQAGKASGNGVLTTGIVLLIVGPVIMQIGVILILPLVLHWAMRLLARFGAGARLGSRDAGRNPSRTVPAVAAIMSTVFVASFSMCMLSGGNVQAVRTYGWSAPLHQASVSLQVFDEKLQRSVPLAPGEVPAVLDRDLSGSPARILQSSPVYNEYNEAVPSYTVPRVPGALPDSYSGISGSIDQVIVGSADDLSEILGKSASAESRATLAAGGIVALYPQVVSKGMVTLDTVPSTSADAAVTPKPTSSVEVEATVQQPEHPGQYAMLMLPATADRLGVAYAPSLVVKQLAANPSNAETDRATGDLQVLSPGLGVSVETGPQAYAATWSWLLLGATTLIALISATIALALARADGRRDDQVLEALGASPRVQRAFGFWQGVVIAGIGAIVGVGLGLVPAFALGLPQEGSPEGYLPFVPPLLQLGLAAFAMPLVIAGGAWVTARRRRPQWSVRVPLG